MEPATTIDPLTGPPVTGVAALLDSLGLTDLAALSAVVAGYATSPAWVPSLSEQDDLPQRLLIRVDSHTLYMRFPFTVTQLWDEIDQLESEIETKQHISTFWLRIA